MSVERLGVVIGGPETKQSAAETNAAIASVAQQAEKTSSVVTKANAASVTAHKTHVTASRELQNAARLTAGEITNAAARYDAMIKAMGGADTATKRLTDSTRSLGVAHVKALEMDKALSASQAMSASQSDKLRSAITALIGPLGSVSQGAASAVGSLSALAAGGGVAIAVVGGLTLIGAAYEKLTEKSRAAKKATDDAIKSLRELAAAQVTGGKLGGEVGLAETRLADLRRQLASSPARGSATSINPGGGLDVIAQRQRVAETQKSYDELARTVAVGEQKYREVLREANQKDSSERTRSLAALVAANRATVSETREARARLANLEADLSSKTASGAPSADRLRLIEDAKALRTALEPTKAELRDVAKAAREAEQAFEHAFKVAIDRSSATFKAINAAFEKTQDLADAEKKRGVASREQAERERLALEAQQEELSLIGKTDAEVRELTKKYIFLAKVREGFSIAGAKQFAQNAEDLQTAKRAAEYMEKALKLIDAHKGKIDGVANASGTPGAFSKGPDDTSKTIEAIRAATGAAQGFAQAFGDAGRTIGNVVGQIGNLASAVSKIGKDGFGAGTALSIGGALVGIASEFGLFRDRAREARESQAAYTRSLNDYLIVQRSSLDEQLRANIARANALIGPGANFQNAEGIAADATRLRLAALNAERDVERRFLIGLADSLDRLAGVAAANEETIRAQAAATDEATRAQQAAAEAANALAEAERMLSIQRTRTDFLGSLGAREAGLTGGDGARDAALRDEANRKEIEAAQELARQGIITADEVSRLATVQAGELVRSIEAINDAARQSGLAEIARQAEEAQRASQQWAAVFSSINTRLIDAYAVINPAEAKRLELMQQQIARDTELSSAIDDNVRARLRELFALQDQASAMNDQLRAQEAVTAAIEAQTAAAERLAGISSDVTDAYLRSAGKTFEADRMRLERERDERLKAAQAAGASDSILDMIRSTFSNNLNRLIADQMRSNTATTAVSDAASRVIDVTDRSRGADVFNPQRDVVTRVAGGLTEVTAVAWLDIGYSQLSELRQIRIAVTGGGSARGATSVNKALGYELGVDELRAGG